jgi:cyclohexyl-isocyanide hydratase
MSLFNVGFVIFPEVTQLDFTGPLQVLARLPQSATHVVAKSEAPVPSDCGLTVLPTHTFATCPPLDLICIPGGSSGVVGAINDRDTIQFVRRQAGTAKYVTSVHRRFCARRRWIAQGAPCNHTLGLYRTTAPGRCYA